MMTIPMMITLLFTPVIALVIHSLACRLPKVKDCPAQRLTVLCGVFAAMVASLGLLFQLDPNARNVSAFLFSGLVSLALAHVYFHFFNMSETARRIRILTQLRRGTYREQGSKNSGYSSESILDIRLGRLKMLNQVSFEDGKYKVKPTLFLGIALVLKFYEKLIFPGRHGSNPVFKRVAVRK